MIQDDYLQQALKLYPLERPTAELIRHNENMTFKVIDTTARYVLRIHKSVSGFANDAFFPDNYSRNKVQSELEIITALRDNTNLLMQSPMPGQNGNIVQALPEGSFVTLLKWVDGQTIDDIEKTDKVYKKIGAITGEMHKYFFDRRPHKTYDRNHYDQNLLSRIAECIDKATQAGFLIREQTQDMFATLAEIRRRLDELDMKYEKSIVHSDLSNSNLIINEEGQITPIDFSLCGYGHFYMDFGVLFGINGDAENRKDIIEGYKNIRDVEINPYYIEPYFALGVLLYIAAQYKRAKEWDWFGGAVERWRRDIFQPFAKGKDLLLMDK